ncbi:tetratricopeptide repeat protein [Thermodesulfitimonas sp.]
MGVRAEIQRQRVPVTEAAPLPLSSAIAFWGIAGLLFFTPFFRGLFFPPEQERALIVAALSFWLLYFGRWLRRKTRFFEHPLDFWVLGLPVVYVLSAFGAVNKGLAVNEIVKAALYFVVFWTVSRLVAGEADIRRLLKVIWASGVLVALAGLATATEIIFIRDGFLGGRIYSSFQYPNALASYLLCVLILGAYLWAWALGHGAGFKNIWPSCPAWVERLRPYAYLFAAGNFLIATVFWGAKSNGGLLTLLIVAPLLLLGVPAERRASLVLHAVQVGVPGLLVALPFVNSATAKNYDLAWLLVFAGLVVAVGVQVFYDLVVRPKGVKKIRLPRWGLPAAAGIAAAAVAVVFLVRPVLGHKILSLIHFRNAVERFYFYRDALEMIAARPLLGWGGGGWQEAYRAYQDYLYNSTQVHGYYFQIGVETGIIGLIVIGGIWLTFLLSAHRLYHGAQGNEERRFLVWVLTVSALGVGLHAAIDFNLSLSALALVLFAIFGMVAGLARPEEKVVVAKRPKKVQEPVNTAPLIAVTTAVVLLVAGSFSLALAGDCALEANMRLAKNDIAGAQKKLERARVFNPFDADCDMLLGRIYMSQGDAAAAIGAAEAALAKSRYSAAKHAELGMAYMNAGRYEAAVAEARQAVAMAPFQVQWYENLARTALNAGYLELRARQQEKARAFFKQAAAVPGKIKRRMATVTPQERKLWVVAPLMEPTPAVNISAGGALYFLGRFPEAAEILQNALKEVEREGVAEQEKEMYAEGCLWLALVSEKQGHMSLKEEYLKKGREAVPAVAEWYKYTVQLPVLGAAKK